MRFAVPFIGERKASLDSAENETREQTQALDRAYVLFERYNKHHKLFAGLQSLKFRYMAIFGKSASEPFKELCGVLNEMHKSQRASLARAGGHGEMRGQLTERDAAEKSNCEAVFSRKLRDDEDAISQRVKMAVEKVENLLQNELRSQLTWWGRTWRWCKSLREKREVELIWCRKAIRVSPLHRLDAS